MMSHLANGGSQLHFLAVKMRTSMHMHIYKVFLMQLFINIGNIFFFLSTTSNLKFKDRIVDIFAIYKYILRY